MKRIAISLFFLLIAASLSPSAHATLFSVWSYQALTDKSDLVIIGKFDHSDNKGMPETFYEIPVIAFDVNVEVQAVLKGHLKDNQVVVHLLKEPPDRKETVTIGGIPFFTFQPDTPYLQFLKKMKDGRFEPVSDQSQPASSFISVREDESDSIKKLFPSHDSNLSKAQQGAAANP